MHTLLRCPVAGRPCSSLPPRRATRGGFLGLIRHLCQTLDRDSAPTHPHTVTHLPFRTALFSPLTATAALIISSDWSVSGGTYCAWYTHRSAGTSSTARGGKLWCGCARQYTTSLVLPVLWYVPLPSPVGRETSASLPPAQHCLLSTAWSALPVLPSSF